MFDNIDKKIKKLAIVTCWINIIFFIIAGIVLLCKGFILAALNILILGPIASWVSSFVLYGFGELIYTNLEINKKTDYLCNRLNALQPKDNDFGISKNPHINSKSGNQQVDVGEEYVVCENCEKTNLKSNQRCWHCGCELPPQ